MPQRDRPREKVLVVLHQERSSAGRVGHQLLQAGFDLDIRRPPLGDELPETLEHHAAGLRIACIRLETGVKQPEAIGLYRAFGYVEIGPFGAYVLDPASVFMEKRLGA